MRRAMSTPTKFTNPPILELILGVQFVLLSELTTAHCGWYWRDVLGTDWERPQDASPIPDQFETFQQTPHWGVQELRLELHQAANTRVLFTHTNGMYRVQVQPTRFILNWKKTEAGYPSFPTMFHEFDRQLSRFEAFVNQNGLGKLLMNQWELTYLNSLDRNTVWTDASDWDMALAGLLGPVLETGKRKFEGVSAEWHYEIPPQRGRLHVSVRSAYENKAILLQTTARGPIGGKGAADWRTGLSVGHDAAVEMFADLATEKANNVWGRVS
jgi:uncharacterized protein (TIGR04255 family)